MDKEEALDLLRRGESELWNQYRKDHPNWRPDLEGENLSKINFAPFGKEAFDLTNANLVGCKLPELDKLVPLGSQFGLDFGNLLESASVNTEAIARHNLHPLSGVLIDRRTSIKSGLTGRASLETLVKLGARFVDQEQLKRERADVARKLFISYPWAEEEIVKKIDQSLRDKGLITIMDKRDFTAGNLIRDEIIRGMSEADAILLFHSRMTVGKPWIEFERDLARELQETAAKKKPPQMIFVALDDTPLPDKDRIAIMAKGKKFPQVCQEIFESVLDLPKTSIDVDLTGMEDYVF